MAVIAIPISLQSMITIGVNMSDTTVSLICQREVLNLHDFQFSYFDMDLQLPVKPVKGTFILTYPVKKDQK